MFSDTVFLVGLFGASKGETQAICSNTRAISVSTTKDVAGFSSFPSIGGRVSGVQLVVPQPLVPHATRRTATISFTVSQAIVSKSGNSEVSITWPPGYFYGFPINAAIIDVNGKTSPAAVTPMNIDTSMFPIVDSNFFDGVRWQLAHLSVHN
jgi:hypothetical protein